MNAVKLIKVAGFGAALLASTAASAQDRFIAHTGGITTAYRCYHAAVAAGLPEASALLLRGDYDATRRGLSIEERGQFKGYARCQSEQDARDFGGPAGAFKTLGCQTIAQARVVGENPNQRIPPPQ